MKSHTSHPAHRWLNAFVLLIGLGMLSFIGTGLLRKNQGASTASNVPAGAVQDATIPKETFFQPTIGNVLGQSDANVPGALKSENYTLGQVIVGGDVTIVSSDVGETGRLEVSDVRGESLMDTGKKEANILITWKTSKLSKAVVHYGKNGTELTQTVEEDGYGRIHSALLSGLDQATTYVYTLAVTDRFGNTVSTDTYAVYTGTKTASLFDLISGAITDTFGWVLKK